jgi:hypothetical protein
LSAFEQYYRAQRLLGEDELPAFFEQLRRPLPLDVRASARASLASRAVSALRQLQQDDAVHGRALHWAGEGVWQWPACAQESRQFLHQQMLRGALQRQESASMLPALVLAPRASHAVLDMCAAPGSKSIQAIELMESDWALGEALAEALAEAEAEAAAAEAAAAAEEEEEEEEEEAAAEAAAEAATRSRRVERVRRVERARRVERSRRLLLDQAAGLPVQAALAFGVVATALASADGMLPPPTTAPTTAPPPPPPPPPPPSPPPLPPPSPAPPALAARRPSQRPPTTALAARRPPPRGVFVANDASLARSISLTHRLTSVNVASPFSVVTPLDAPLSAFECMLMASDCLPHQVVTSLDARWWPRLDGWRFDRILCVHALQPDCML